MASYNNQYATKINITPENPNLRGIEDNYSNDCQTNLGGYGLGDIYQLDYDRNKIEQIFNQGTDAQYALMQKQAQVAENNYANQQFQNQQNTIEALRAQRNEQIASGMARGISAASDQAVALGVQQEAMNGALDLAQNRQMQADQIAAEYAQNVVKALQEANSVKQAMADVAAKLYEADMLGYTGELSALGQLDANESNRYGYDLGLEGTQYQADRALEGTKYQSDNALRGTLDYNQKYLAAAQAQAAATRYAAEQSAAATKAAAAATGSSTKDVESLLDKALKDGINLGYSGNSLINYAKNYVIAQDTNYKNWNDSNPGQLWDTIDEYAVGKKLKDQTKLNYENLKNGNFSLGGNDGAGSGTYGGR